MQFKLALLTAALATLAVANSTPPSSDCSTGPIQCCDSTQTADQAGKDPKTLALLGLIGVVIGDVGALVGLDCSGINVAGGGTCTAQTVCCTNNALGGLISIGCAPITL